MDEEPDPSLATCDVCDHLVRPRNESATGHICERCIEDIQIGERVVDKPND